MIAREDVWQDSDNGGSSQLIEDFDSQLLTWPIVTVTAVIALCLGSMFAMLVMMPKSPSSQQCEDDDESPSATNEMRFRRPRRSQRFRSLSVSVDLQFIDRGPLQSMVSVSDAAAAKTGWQRQQLRVLAGTAGDRCRTMSTNYIERYRLLHHADCADLTAWKMRGLEMLRRVPEAFPFQSLPVDCQLAVFAHLDANDRGIAAKVCRDWHQLMHTPTLWTFIDFTEFPLCRHCAQAGRECTPLCYAAYKSRMKGFFEFLYSIRPPVHRLRAAFDIGDRRDGWLDLMEGLLCTARCHDLTDVDFNWKETPVKPLTLNVGSNATWSTGDYYDVVFHHRYRQRQFVKFFDMLVAAAPNITRLSVPFDWYDRTIRAMGRLRYLESLTLKQYFWMQSVDPLSVEQLVASLPLLRTLSLEVWSPSGHGLLAYSICSETLEHLDMLECRGVCLGHVNLPRLRSLAISHQPMCGPLIVPIGTHPMDCLMGVLSTGVPVLESLNGYKLPAGWNDGHSANDEGLEILLKKICPCNTHKP